MSLYKTGVWKQNEIHEFNAVENYSNTTYSYTPTKDTSNSCQGYYTVDFTEYSNSTSNLVIRVEMDVEYSGFDSSSTAGTFSMRWQGANYSVVESTWKWAGNNYVTQALTDEKPLTTLVNGTGSGTYHYNHTATIPTSWWATYSQSRVGIRTDYSNGVGKITFKNLKVYLNSEFGNGNAKINSNQNIISNNFIEI